MTSVPDQIFSQIVRDLFDQPIISNLFRPHYVERLVAFALGDGFQLVSADWAGWDIESAKGVRIEVKQSAAWQTWSDATGAARPSPGNFDIAPRTGHWGERGTRWVDHAGRQAQIYIFAWHPVADAARVDHRDPGQWRFYAVPASELPAGQRNIRQSVVARRWPETRIDELRENTLKLIEYSCAPNNLKQG